jgi:hypothetical protein
MKTMLRFKQGITASVLAIIVVHVVVVMVLTFFPGLALHSTSKIGRFYSYFIHLGPFYREESIRSSPHVIVASKDREVDLVSEYHARYLKQPWRLDHLLLRDYARRSADKLATNHRQKHSLESMATLAEKCDRVFATYDSLHVSYIHKWYLPDADRWVSRTVYSTTFVRRHQ